MLLKVFLIFFKVFIQKHLYNFFNKIIWYLQIVFFFSLFSKKNFFLAFKLKSFSEFFFNFLLRYGFKSVKIFINLFIFIF